MQVKTPLIKQPLHFQSHDKTVFLYCNDLSAALDTHPDVLSASLVAPLLLCFLLFTEVQVSVLCWLNSVEDWLPLKMDFFQQ